MEIKDWIKGSIFVNEDGDPIPMFHGSKEKFDHFDYNKIGSNGRTHGAGFYFTPNKQLASGYGDVNTYALRITKPIYYNQGVPHLITLKKIVKSIIEVEAELTDMDWKDGFASNYTDSYRYTSIEGLAVDVAQKLYNNKTFLDIAGELVSSGCPIIAVNQGIFNATGYDAYVSNGYNNLGDNSQLIVVAMFNHQIRKLD